VIEERNAGDLDIHCSCPLLYLDSVFVSSFLLLFTLTSAGINQKKRKFASSTYIKGVHNIHLAYSAVIPCKKKKTERRSTTSIRLMQFSYFICDLIKSLFKCNTLSGSINLLGYLVFENPALLDYYIASTLHNLLWRLTRVCVSSADQVCAVMQKSSSSFLSPATRCHALSIRT
jgi:hypothetical protein